MPRCHTTSLLALLLVTASPLHAATTCPDGPTVDGIDVSKWQGAIAWDQVATSDVRFAFIRVNHGLEDIDERFDANWAGAKANGILRGAYQYFLNDEDALVQADLLLERMGPLGPDDLPPVLDIEDEGSATPEELRAAIWTWIDRVEGALGKKPIIYTYRYFWETRVQTAEFEEAGYPLWFANINVDCPNLPSLLSQWDFWQKSWEGSIPGINGDVDLDVFNGDEAELYTFTVGEPVCGDGYCTGSESAASCTADCEGCAAVPPEGRVIDDMDPCASFSGTPEAWRWNGDAGHEGSFRWTYAYAGAAPDNHGVYTLEVQAPGTYDVEVYLDSAAGAGSALAPYKLRHAGEEEVVVIDQSAASGWVSLGEHAFTAGGDQWLRLDDNTGEAVAAELRLVFDAVRLVPKDVTLPDAGAPPDDDAGAPPGEDAGAPPPEDAGVTDEDDAGVPTADSGPPLDLPPSVVGGCGCSTSEPEASLPFGALGVFLALRRRRRAAISPRTPGTRCG